MNGANLISFSPEGPPKGRLLYLSLLFGKLSTLGNKPDKINLFFSQKYPALPITRQTIADIRIEEEDIAEVVTRLLSLNSASFPS